MHDSKPSQPQQIKALINESLASYRRQLDAGGPAQNLTMYLGSRQGTYPKILMRHPLLHPNDKVTWVTLKDQLEDAGARLACLDASITVSHVGVDSKKTVTVSLLILRALRLITYYRLDQGRNDKGQFQESAMACLVFDDPLSLADTLVLDPEYLDFLRELAQHRHRRVRHVATLIVQAVREEVGRSPDLLEPRTHLDHIAARHDAQQFVDKQNKQKGLTDDNPFFGVEYADLKTWECDRGKNFPTVENYKGPGSLYENHREKNFPTVENFARGKIFPTANSSCSSNNKITTTPTPPSSPTVPELMWPPSLAEGERAKCAVILDVLPLDQWQEILDELEGRIVLGKKNSNPLRYRMQWLKQVCRNVLDGTFTPVLGVDIRLEREKRQRLASAPKPAAEPAKSIDREAAKAALAQLREVTKL
jgi:hypothetical protein